MTKITESLSIQQARKLVLLSQEIPPSKQSGKAIDNTLKALENLGYVQIDTISVIQRAHHHTLWNRNPDYTASHLNQLIADKKAFEYWSHAAAYLPMRDYRYSLPRKQVIANEEQNHWYKRDKVLMNSILKRISTEGPLMSKDFVNKGKKTADWESKPAKQALEYLFMQGDLMISHRVNFHKVYDITERVLPKEINTSIPTKEEYVRFLIRQFLQANGLGQANEIGYLLKNIKALISNTIEEMHLNNELIKLTVGELTYYALPNSMELLNNPLSRSKLKILSPFDNLLIQRKRIQNLFNFNYQIECYVPSAKRKYGYFSLPILWDGKLVARMDCKAERDKSVLHINHLALEPHLKKEDAFATALSNELKSFMKFNNCSSINLHKTSPEKFKLILQPII